jgi:hypothetical protein
MWTTFVDVATFVDRKDSVRYGESQNLANANYYVVEAFIPWYSIGEKVVPSSVKMDLISRICHRIIATLTTAVGLACINRATVALV